MKAIFKGSLLVFAILTGITVFAQPTGVPPRDAAYEVLGDERQAIPYDGLREADIFWKKRVWRVIDTREKINLPFVYPKSPFIMALFDALESGELKAYNDAAGDEFEQELTYERIQSQMSSVDSTWTVSPYTYNDTLIVSNTEIDPLTITKFRLKEDWIFDEETSTMVVRILGIAPVVDVIDPQTGIKRGEKLMFWIYYPEARDLLAKSYAFNPWNEAIKMSWDDVFSMRLFNSYIVKEGNVYDREIESYAAGIDAVLESERIKREIFEFEHNLWSF